MATTYRQFVRALSRFEEAVREHAFIGTKHPGDHLSIEREYHASKLKVIEAFANKGAD